MTGRKLKMEDRWKRRKAPKRRIMLVRVRLVPEEAAPAGEAALYRAEEVTPAPTPVVDEARVRLDQGRVDYGSVYRARIKSIGEDGLKEEFQWRAFEAVVALYRANNPSATIDEAAASVRGAINSTQETTL